MNKPAPKKKIATPLLRDDEFNSGVGKVLLAENDSLKKEVKNLKKSLKSAQDALETLRSKRSPLSKSVLGFLAVVVGGVFVGLILYYGFGIG